MLGSIDRWRSNHHAIIINKETDKKHLIESDPKKMHVIEGQFVLPRGIYSSEKKRFMLDEMFQRNASNLPSFYKGI